MAQDVPAFWLASCQYGYLFLAGKRFSELQSGD